MKVTVHTYQKLVCGGKPIDPDEKWTSYTTKHYNSGVSSVVEDPEGNYELPDGSKRAYVVWVE